MKILITGATGFVGTWLTKKLLDLGHDIRVLSQSKELKFPFDMKNIELIQGNIIDPEVTQKASRGVHSIFHLAGLVGYSRSLRQAMYQTNVVGTTNVITACQKEDVEKLVYVSSVAAVGASFDGRSLLNEKSPFNLHRLNLGYFETKREAEQLVLKATSAGTIRSVVLNPSNIYGPGDAKKGSRSTQVKIAKGKFPFIPPGGVNVIYIEDVIEALCSAWQKGRNGERYILAGENIRVRKLFEIIAECAGVKPPTIPLPKVAVLGMGKFGDLKELLGKKSSVTSENAWASVLYHWYDNSKAKTELGLNPQPARVAIGASVNWMKENGII